MNKKVTVVLAVLVAALAGYIVLFERGSLSSKELDARKGKVLTSFVRDKLTKLVLTHGSQKVVLERSLDADGMAPWKMLEPQKAAADQDAIDKLLGELEWLSARRLLENVSEADLKTFGLKAPAFSLLFRVSGDDHTLKLGAADVHGQSYYAQVDGETTVFVVPKTVVEALDHDVGNFRDKEFVGDITSAWARRLELSNAAGKAELQRENGRWWVLAAPKSYADSKRVSMLVDRLSGLRAVRFLQGAERSAALVALAKGATVDLRVVPDEHREDKQAQRFLLRFAGDCVGHPGERYAQAGDQGDPVCVSADDLEPFDGKPDALRLAGLFDADPSEIEKLELSTGPSKLALRREGEKWLREGGAEPDRESVEVWLADLKTQQASAFLPARELVVQTTLTLSLATEQRPAIRVLVDLAAQQVLVRRDDEPALLSFPLSLADRLAMFEGRFGPLEPWAGKQPSQVVGIDAQHGALQRKLSLKEGTWQSNKGPAADTGSVREQVRELIKLRLLSIVSNQARPEHGLEKPRAQLSLVLNEGAPLLLALGAATARGSYARVGETLVVEVEPAVEKGMLELAGGVIAVDAGVEGDAHAHDDEHEHEEEHEDPH